MKKEVLDHGFVELVDKMGDDYSILRAARVSTGSDVKKGDAKDRGLIRYLYRNDHLSPFSFVSFQFHVKCPIFVARQWFRHRSMDYNEASARYKEFEWEVFYPETWRKQDPVNKQNSLDELDFNDTHQELYDSYKQAYESCRITYENALAVGAAREQARMIMPVGQYTDFFINVNMRNLFHFLELRLDEHAQYEIRVFAEAILKILSSLDDIKWSIEVFKETYRIKQLFYKVMDKAFRKKDGMTINMLEDYLKKVAD